MISVNAAVVVAALKLSIAHGAPAAALHGMDPATCAWIPTTCAMAVQGTVTDYCLGTPGAPVHWSRCRQPHTTDIKPWVRDLAPLFREAQQARERIRIRDSKGRGGE